MRATLCFLLFLISTTSVASSNALPAFRMRTVAEPASLDWSKKLLFFEVTVVLNLMDGLVNVDESFNATPALAETWDISSDRKTYVFHLRKDVKWSDGVPLKAKDFIFSWKRALSLETKSPYAPYFFDILNAEKFHRGELKDFNSVGVKAIDDFTLEIKLGRPSFSFLQQLYFFVFFPQREDVFKAGGPDWWKPSKHVTLGPYRIKEWISGQKLVFESSSNYYRKDSRPARVEVLIETDDQKARAAAYDNKIDLLLQVNASDIEKFSTLKEHPWKLHQFDPLSTTFLGSNLSRPAMKSLALRKAIAMTLDREKLPQQLQNGVLPAYGLIPPRFSGSGHWVPEFNPSAARAEFKGQAHLPKLVLVHRKTIHDKVAAFIKDQLEKNLVGLEIELQSVPQGEFEAVLSSGKYDLFLDPRWADIPDSIRFLDIFTKNNSSNHTHWSNPAFDRLIQKAIETSHVTDRLKAISSAQNILLKEQMVVFPIYHPKITAMSNEKIQEFYINPLLGHMYFSNVKLKP